MKKKELKSIISLLLKENKQLKESLSNKYNEHLNDAVRYSYNIHISDNFKEDVKDIVSGLDREIRLDTKCFIDWLNK